MLTFGDEIKRLREQKGLTQKALAEAIGISQPTIAILEKNKRSGLAIGTIYRLSRALDVDCGHWEQFFPPAVAEAVESAPKKRKEKADGQPTAPGSSARRR